MKNSLYAIVCILALQSLNAMLKPERLKQFPEQQQKRIEDLLAKITRDHEQQDQGSMRAEQRTIRFKKYVPKKKVDLGVIKRFFPYLFTGIPERYQQAIVDYGENLYGDAMTKKLENIHKKGTDAQREFKWEALGTLFERAPFYGNGYLFIVDPQNKKNTESHFTHLPNFLMSKYNSEAIETRLKNATTEQERKELAKKLQTSKENTKQIAQTLTQNYKIHMMPAGSLTEILVKLLEEAKKDPELNWLISNFKLKVSSITETDGTTFPLIAFYAPSGKKNAQKLLNKLYHLFKGIPGSNKQPRYNARVSDLFWIAQGDGDYKTDNFAQYYEPNRTYYRADFTGKIENYHLVHPETGKEII